ncbi:MAG: imidazole glycerol phosphate synthase subunit HisH [Coriobacteriales bacterium]|jgi:glutamine amidotransferase|nr:imidazole glycerol phosphate synthase subunit HisH [Coriobacteriales bacterium]
MFVVVDYCKGNLRSVQKGLERAGCDARVSASPADINNAEAIVLPGVGSFTDASETMCASGQMDAIRSRVADGVPFLGICLGLQLLFDWGDEGAPAGSRSEGLGVLPGHCRRIDALDAAGRAHKVPHVGWNQVRFSHTLREGLSAGDHAGQGAALLLAGIEDGSNFYFTHSYQCVPAQEADICATTDHATGFPSVVARGSAFGVQFHPEKSSHKGLMVLQNFVNLARRM